MSGAAGGSRIKKEDLKATIRDYRDNILKPLGLDKSYSITGVRSRPEKDIFGDIDIVVSFPGGEKKELKQDLAKFLSQVDAIPTIPHKKNNKYFIHGNIVSTLYPIFGKEDEYVQIDNIVTTSKEEGNFTFNMLDLPAQEQTLAIGLAKTIFTELDEKQIENLFKELNVPTNERPGEGEEYDFNLNPSELTLQIVPIGKNDGRTIWKSNKFEDVKKLTTALGINIETDKFDDIVSKIKNFKNRRSIDRLKGMFVKNIRVGPAEKELEKGIKKQQAIDAVAALEEKYSPLVMSLIKPFIKGETILLEEEQSETIALMPGAFKPPHRDHLRRINAAAENSDKAIILISPLDRVKEGETPISAKQSLAIWQLYKDKGVLASNVEFLISPDNAPVKTAYDISTANPQNQYIGVYGKDDAVRWKNLPNEKYPNLRASDFGIIADLSASGLRAALKNNEDITPWMPDGITPEEYKQALGLDQVQELFEPSSNIYDYDQNGLDYSFMSDYGFAYMVGITPESENRISIDFGIEDEYGDVTFPETNEGNVYKIIATIADIVKNYLDQHPEIEIISWSSVAKKGEKKIGDTQRDKLYKLVVKKQGDLKDEDIVLKDNEYWAYLKGYNPLFERVEGDSIVCDDCGWTWKIKDGGNDLYNCHKCGYDNTPKETNKFFEPIQDKNINLNISSEPSRVDYYKDHIQNVIPSDFKVEKNKDKIVVSNIKPKTGLENNLEFKELLVSLTMYMMDQINIEPLPDLVFIEDDVQNAKDMLGRTAYYNHNDKCITLYTYGRHPKDILRSYAHEMIHHKQNLEGRLKNQIHTKNINEDDYLKEIELEAYRDGNGRFFRQWENSIKENE